MSAAPDTAGARFSPADDHFHRDAIGEDWWATETSWFSFHHPERRLGGWLYTLVRPNIGTVQGGVWVWDDSAWLPWEVPYSVNYSALPLRPGQDLTGEPLPTGVGIEVLESAMSYRLTYADGDRLSLDLRFDGVMEPEPLRATGSTFGSAHHFDQLGRVTGEVVLHGEVLQINCLAMRDRTWGRRPEDRPRQAAYVTGAVDDANAFLAVTDARSGDQVTYGFLRRHGRVVALAEGVRRVRRDPVQGWIDAVELDLVDVEGTAVRAVGTPVSRIILNRHTFIDINSLLRWDVDGREGWGEDQDMWPVHTFSAFRRQQRTPTGDRR